MNELLRKMQLLLQCFLGALSLLDFLSQARIRLSQLAGALFDRLLQFITRTLQRDLGSLAYQDFLLQLCVLRSDPLLHITHSEMRGHSRQDFLDR